MLRLLVEVGWVEFVTVTVLTPCGILVGLELVAVELEELLELGEVLMADELVEAGSVVVIIDVTVAGPVEALDVVTIVEVKVLLDVVGREVVLLDWRLDEEASDVVDPTGKVVPLLVVDPVVVEGGALVVELNSVVVEFAALDVAVGTTVAVDVMLVGTAVELAGDVVFVALAEQTTLMAGAAAWKAIAEL